MSETRKIAAILVADVVGYSRLAGANEEGTLARLRALRSDLIDPGIAAHHGRIVKRTARLSGHPMIKLPHEFLNAIFAAVIIVAVRRSRNWLRGSPDVHERS
jgi:class 3 adenylate cyclase